MLKHVMLKRIPLLTLLLLAAAPPAQALELKNFRPCYAPVPFGANRTDAKCLPGDFIFLTYDIEGLKFDDKTGKASFVTILELFDSKANLVFNKEDPQRGRPSARRHTHARRPARADGPQPEGRQVRHPSHRAGSQRQGIEVASSTTSSCSAAASASPA